MARILVLGASGMAGHMACLHLAECGHDVLGLARTPAPGLASLDLEDSIALEKFIDQARPEVVLNCAGVLIQDSERDPVRAIRVDALLPQVLSLAARSRGFRLIHVSTDCVFSGSGGPYHEGSPRDGSDVYGMAKALGEVARGTDLTFRTSIVGPELKAEGRNLFAWFMRQKGPIRGYSRCLWGGVTTLELAKAVHFVVENPLSGLTHLTRGVPISRYDLLRLFAELWGRKDLVIEKDDTLASDRSLISRRSDFIYPVPPFRDMLEELRQFMQRHGDLYRHYD
jgi:dTDP-4-dehydrorhamnose reductase